MRAANMKVEQQQQHLHHGQLQRRVPQQPLYATVQKKNKALKYLSGEELIRLELKYGGAEVSHWAAIVIQRAFRAKRLQRQFDQLMTLAMSSDRLERRLSLLGPDPEQTKTPPPPYVANLDKILVECSERLRPQQSSQDARQMRSQQRQAQNLRRSVSMSQGGSRQQQQQQHNPRAPAVVPKEEPVEPALAPCPPSCPPLRGEEFYPGAVDDIYVTRDDLYARDENIANQQQQQQQPQQPPPRPPQRTVSFLANGTLPRKMSHVQKIAALKKEQELQDHQQQHQQICVNSDSNLYYYQNQQKLQQQQQSYHEHSSLNQSDFNHSHNLQHNRSYSSPAPLSPHPPPPPPPLAELRVLTKDQDLPLPPPPYISPPTLNRSSPDEDSPLPPPPALISQPPPQHQEQCQTARTPCDSASSSSSVDSGCDRGSSYGPSSPLWVSSPQFPVPEVFERQMTPGSGAPVLSQQQLLRQQQLQLQQQQQQQQQQLYQVVGSPQMVQRNIQYCNVS